MFSVKSLLESISCPIPIRIADDKDVLRCCINQVYRFCNDNFTMTLVSIYISKLSEKEKKSFGTESQSISNLMSSPETLILDYQISDYMCCVYMANGIK